MHPPIGKTHRQYVHDRLERDPEFAAAYEEATIDLGLALALSSFREQVGMSQRDLAAATGIKQPMIARIERGSQSPRYNTLVKLLRGLHAEVVIGPDGQVELLPARMPSGQERTVQSS